MTSEFQPLARNTQGVIPFAIGTGEVPKFSYLDFDGTIGEYASTADSVLNSVTGDIWILADIAAAVYNSGAERVIVSKFSDAGNYSYQFSISDQGKLQFRFSLDGTAALSFVTLADIPAANLERLFVSMQRRASDGEITFFINGVFFETVASTAGALFDSTTDVFIGARPTSGSNPFDGRIYSVRIYDGFSTATIALNFNPTVTHPTYGPDGVIDGGFDTADPAWITGTANISGGVLNMTANGGSATQEGVVAVGTIARILVEWEQNILTGTRLRWISRNGLNSANSGTVVASSSNLNPIAGNASGSGSFWALIDITDGYTFNLFNESGVTATVDNVRERVVLPAVDPITGAVWIFAPDDSIIVVAPVFLNGLPIDGLAAVYTADNGTVEYYSQGMPFDSDGRLVITTTGDIDHHGAGANPYDAAGRLCVAGETDLIYMGIAFAEGGKFAIS